MPMIANINRERKKRYRGSHRREEETPAPATVSTPGHTGGSEETTKILSALLWRDSSDS